MRVALRNGVLVFFKSVCVLFLFRGLGGDCQVVTEIYETCTAEEGLIARCGPGANCFIMESIPTCHCVVDVATGLPLAGNPYKACTWDVSGSWQLFSFFNKRTGFYQEILSPISNEPFVIRLDRTDAMLKTKYIVGAIFVITSLTSFSLGVCTRAFLDAHDNTSIIFEQAEGFLDQWGRSILLRTALLDATLIKTFPFKKKIKDKWNIKGKWQKNDGAEVKILDLKKPHNWPAFFTKVYKNWAAYWYNDDSYGAPLLRLSTALFLDKTLKPEKIAFNTKARFLQVGWYGALRFGSNRINLYSPADGKEIFTLLRIDTLPPFTPFGPGPELAQQFAPTATNYVGSASTMQIQVDQPPATPSDPEVSTDDVDGIEIIDRMPDRPAARANGSGMSTAIRPGQRRLEDIGQFRQTKTPRRAIQAQANRDYTGRKFSEIEDEARNKIGHYDKLTEAARLLSLLSLKQGFPEVKLGRYIDKAEEDTTTPDLRHLQFDTSLPLQNRVVGPYATTAQVMQQTLSADPTNWFSSIEQRYVEALLNQQQQLNLLSSEF